MSPSIPREPDERVVQYADSMGGRFALWAGARGTSIWPGLTRQPATG
jgi:hypothetical protein